MDTAKEQIFQSLLDAGYTKQKAESFMSYINAGDLESGIKDLKSHRSALVKRIHKENRQLHCLDYLMDFLEKSS